MLESLPRVFLLNKYLITVTSDYEFGESICVRCEDKYPSIFFNGIIKSEHNIDYIFSFGYFSIYNYFCKCRLRNNKLLVCQIFSNQLPDKYIKDVISEKMSAQIIELITNKQSKKRKRLVSVV